MTDRELVMYGRSFGCPFMTTARKVFADLALPYREIMIDKDPAARERVLNWTGFLSVPTLVVAEAGSDLPYEEPLPLPRGASPRGVDRGAMITEPYRQELIDWLVKHAFISAADSADSDSLD